MSGNSHKGLPDIIIFNFVKMRSLYQIIIFIAALALLPSCINEDDSTIEYVAVGDKLPAFTVVLNDGSRYDSTQPGASVIIFFNTSCADCQRELPRLDSQYKAGEFEGQRVVCISREEEEASVAAFWLSNHLSLPYSAQTDRRIFNMFASAGIPRSYETNDQGIIIHITKFE